MLFVLAFDLLYTMIVFSGYTLSVNSFGWNKKIVGIVAAILMLFPLLDLIGIMVTVS